MNKASVQEDVVWRKSWIQSPRSSIELHNGCLQSQSCELVYYVLALHIYIRMRRACYEQRMIAKDNVSGGTTEVQMDATATLGEQLLGKSI